MIVDNASPMLGEALESIEDAYNQMGTELLRFATSVVGASSAQDVLATAMLKCLEAELDLRTVDVRPYLYRAVLNECRSLHRRSSVARRSFPLSLLANRTVSDGSAELESRLSLRRTLERLSGQQRAVLFLTYWEGLSIDDISRRLGVSPGTVKKQLARARQKLRKDTEWTSLASG